MVSVRDIKESVLHLLFPNVCVGCGNELLAGNTVLCLKCAHSMPETNFEMHRGNPIEKKFWGRLHLENATAQYYFTRESLMQRLMHQFKYRGNRELGLQLGRMMGESIRQSGRFDVDALIPLPLFSSREKRRGFNQATILCEGMAEHLKVPVLNNVVVRTQFTDTQTKKGRIERWQNIEGKFVLSRPDLVSYRHMLLVDDVVTTGATLEACSAEIVKVDNARLSIATLCYAQR